MNCWEFKRCADYVRNICPAYPAVGKSCWTVPGTKCDYGRIANATPRERASHCGRCGFYLQRVGNC